MILMIQLHILYFSAVHIYLFQRNWSQSLLACCENLGLITVTRRFSVATCARHTSLKIRYFSWHKMQLKYNYCVFVVQVYTLAITNGFRNYFEILLITIPFSLNIVDPFHKCFASLFLL